jgi:hypothetical protein
MSTQKLQYATAILQTVSSLIFIVVLYPFHLQDSYTSEERIWGLSRMRLPEDK